jgi:signal transduction histidine kinase
MRTPLAVILASSSQALARPRSSEEYVRSLSEIRSAAERASTGVNEMLDLVRFESGQMMPRIGPLRLDLLAEEVAASVRPDGVETVAEIVADPADPVVVAADMALLRQAIDNVVRNAARRSTRVELLAHVDGRDGVIDVVDDGPGFDPAVLPRVFERYQRGDRRGEAGIGLAIVKAIATAHGGSVAARNNDGGGATVSIRIPLART